MTASLPTLNNKTLNESILEALSAYILTNHLKKGDRLPSQMTMAKQLNVSRTALREAIAHMEARGVVKQTQGVGTFITFNPDEYKTNVVMETSTTEMIRAMGKVPGTSEVICDWRPILPEFKDSFPGVDQLICVQRVRTADGDPMAVSYAFLAPGLIDSPKEIEDHKHKESLFDFLELYCGKAPIFFDDQIEIVYPDETVARKLGIDQSKAIFRFVRHQYSRDRQLLVVASDFFNIDKLSLQVTRYRLFPLLNSNNIKEA